MERKLSIELEAVFLETKKRKAKLVALQFPEGLKTRAKEIAEEIENKTAKLGFDFVWRFIYIDRRDAFTPSNISAMWGAFRQFGTLNLNLFKPNLKSLTFARGVLLKKNRIMRKKRFLYDNYRIRHFPKIFSVLNTEELATIYHFPLTSVKPPLLRKIESKRGSPPPELPVESFTSQE